MESYEGDFSWHDELARSAQLFAELAHHRLAAIGPVAYDAESILLIDDGAALNEREIGHSRFTRWLITTERLNPHGEEEEEMAYWVDRTLAPTPEAPLGKVEYVHVHNDGTEHPTTVDYPPGFWGGTPGVYHPEVKVRCQDCWERWTPDDDIRVG